MNLEKECKIVRLNIRSAHDHLTFIIDRLDNENDAEEVKDVLRNARSSLKSAGIRVDQFISPEPMVEPITKED